ncbi:MAG: TIGR04211 family SH3 domain-containing protein [Deltaproteobacteria bacterium]|uniref:TIGR04211 family SH3 domain-containing protein n=1 Tax=Desulfobacula sp. TaxID=2593537 RepID=UPI0019982628|nr:TIGR04211 family SH3 domain-containing protein [Candidatus Desulfobacula maris]MBL6993575.1 TIGR04211 family SH3 domain-containing protein [Desulfobacula sp.]
MKKKYKYLLIMFLWMVFFVSPLFAEDIYVAGITKVTMRTGPGIEHKIIDILTTGDKLEMVEYQKDWSQVKTDKGRIGWVLSRFLTQDIPEAFLIEKLKKDNQELIDNLKKDNQELISKFGALEEENKILAGKNAALVLIEEKYNKLKQESGDFLTLEANYKKIMEEFEAKKGQIKTLENNLNQEQKFWFLIGAGVFIFGLLLGLSTRKKKRSGLL